MRRRGRQASLLMWGRCSRSLPPTPPLTFSLLQGLFRPFAKSPSLSCRRQNAVSILNLFAEIFTFLLVHTCCTRLWMNDDLDEQEARVRINGVSSYFSVSVTVLWVSDNRSLIFLYSSHQNSAPTPRAVASLWRRVMETRRRTELREASSTQAFCCVFLKFGVLNFSPSSLTKAPRRPFFSFEQ